jgi:hypothetical protein
MVYICKINQMLLLSSEIREIIDGYFMASCYTFKKIPVGMDSIFMKLHVT